MISADFHSMRHRVRYRPQTRGPTSRRLAAARRALERERERYALFADQVAAEQETAEERIDRFDQRGIDQDQGHRDLAAKHWRWGRQLDGLAAEIKASILEAWNRTLAPPEAHYFADFVRTRLKRLGIPVQEDA